MPHALILLLTLPVFVAFTIQPCSADSETAPREITLKECLERTLAYSRDVLIANEGRNMSRGRYIEERSAALPQFRADAHVARAHNDQYPLQGFPVELTEYAGNVKLTQALFTWGQIGAAIKAAGYDKTSAEHQLREAKQLALREAATSFYDLLLTLELAKVARDNVAQKQRHLDETQRRHQMEVATDYDVLSASVALANAQPALAQAENDIRLAGDRVGYYMGIREDFKVSGSLICRTRRPETLEVVLERARTNRPEVAYYESRVGVFKELLRVAKAGDKPRLDFQTNLGWSSYDTITDQLPGQHWDAGIYLSFPIFDGFLTKGKVIQAKSRLATTDFEMKKLLDNIALEARSAINRVDESIRVIEALEATTTQAERLLHMAELGYKNGVKTKLEVDDAESNLLAARINLVKAQRDYVVAQTRLLWIMGEDLQTALTTSDFLPACR
ncbi:TolC family protein [Syntrophobacter fumaroxidans]|uniref:Outer membrane efflux protein n=1 Tax=Syntrophobacter fumaroxidans (strain DSM 10017 / MPOB) TaxID=335543 RepID=A0LGA8_SYNFM|nr:TolC family protein [Syntrophobacter fumaroxidans]ABK16460.1 outer membrane efflux protein [Syntrophobacter fumaroxidans MPOB]